MANGSSHEGPARADRLREQFAKNNRMRLAAIDEARTRGELPSYNDDSQSELSVTRNGVISKLGLPRPARIALGLGLTFLLCCLGVAVIITVWPAR